MTLSSRAIRIQLSLAKNLMNTLSLKTIRKGHNMIGELMKSRRRDEVILKKRFFDNFKSCWIMPKDLRRDGVILYLHGGGYVCGDLEFSLGFGSELAVLSGARVLCAAYRLAPEHRYPAALEDALEAYKYLLGKGYHHSHITLCGESAGGGLCFSLCVKLKELGLPLPSGIVAISPWTDLTLSGESYDLNKERDPSISKELLEYFADNYTDDKTDPMVSPLFADLEGMPDSLIFVGGDEIMLSDATGMYEALQAKGCNSTIVVAKDKWHAYLLYGLPEDRKDLSLLNRFLNQVMPVENKLRWLPLDNAAKIYPAARTSTWSNVFRLSCTLKDNVDTDVLSNALDITIRRFPSIAVKLRKGLFWYYLQQISFPPQIRSESSYPLTRMNKYEIEKCAFRIIVYRNRIALEIFHSLTDGTGAMIFLKTLVAEYLHLNYGEYFSAERGVLGRLEEPSDEEFEDSFQKHSGDISASRKENTAWRVTGSEEKDGFLNLTCFKVPVKEALEQAHKYGVSLTCYLTAVMMQALQNLQNERIEDRRKRKPIKVLIPVNLRKLYGSKTLRNFALYITPEILPRLGEYSFEEICKVISCRMSSEITQKQMSMKIATNVNSERLFIVRIMPLFIKNIVMKAVFDTYGERKSCLTVSNLGAVDIPEAMKQYVTRMDFILGVQANAPYNCGVLSYGDTLYINFIRNICESDLERHFHSVLMEHGITAEVESNNREGKV